MIEVPDVNYPKEERINLYTDYLIDDLIKNVSIYILRENLITSFYNFSDFFLQQRVVEDEVKDSLKQRLIKILQEKGYKLAYVFNKTGIIIATKEEELQKSTWKSNLDFSPIKDD